MENYLTEIWRSVLSEVEKSLSKPSFETWLKSTKPLSFQDNTMVVEVPNDFARDWLQNHYRKTITSAIEKISQYECDIHFVTAQRHHHDDLSQKSANYREIFSPEQHQNRNQKTVIPKTKSNSSNCATIVNENEEKKRDLSSVCNWLNPKYTFHSFVIGSSNRLAHAASLAVAESPSKAYNPLFIYGGVGLGKTHLLHAIGHYLISHNISEQITYLSSEKFTNQFINAIRDNKTTEFRNIYRNSDILLIDDIQFLAGKEQTQEEFFHTFNALHESNKQIVISSDRPPKDIPTLEDRLRSRFEWGLITDIQTPDFETRVAILRKKSTIEGITIPNDVLMYIAQKIESNIRELEGALIRITAYCSLEDKQINMKLAEEALKDFLATRKKNNITVEDIISTTASHFRISPQDIKSKKRSQNISLPRQIAMYLCRELTDYSLPKIGYEFGGKDHTTVIHAHRKITKDLSNDDNLSRSTKEIKETLYHQ